MKYDLFNTLYQEALEYGEHSNDELFIAERGWQEWMGDYSSDELAIILKTVYRLANSPLKENRGGSRAEFTRIYNIPVRTVENWEAGTREAPAYVKELIDYSLLIEKLYSR